MIPIHDSQGKLVARYDPDTKRVEDPWGHLLFYHDALHNTIEIARGERKAIVPLDALREIAGVGVRR